MVPRDSHVLISRPVNIILYGKGSLQMGLRILRLEDYPGLSRWVLNVTTSVHIKDMMVAQPEDNVMTEARC